MGSHAVAPSRTFVYTAFWGLSVTLYVTGRYLDELYRAYSHVAAGDDLPELLVWAEYLVSMTNAQVLIPVLLLSPQWHRLGAWAARLLHGIGVASLALGLLPLLTVSWDSDVWKHWLEIEGVITGRAAGVYMGMLLLAILRRSPVMDAHGCGYQDLLGFHRAGGWWCVAMSLLHSLAFFAYYYVDGGWRGLWSTCFPAGFCYPRDEPCVNTLGLVNFFGVLAVVACAVLALFSRERVRRAVYERFYYVHVTAAAFFVVFAALHCFCVMLLVFAGLVLYGFDRWSARQHRLARPDVNSEMICSRVAPGVVLLSLLMAAPALQPGTRWIYLCVENIDKMQWHPFSIIHNGDRALVLVKGLGDWSQSLCGLVLSGERLKINVEGCFGRPLCQPGKRGAVLVMIAGGIGVCPFVDLLCGLDGTQGSQWARVKLIWAVRRHEYDGLCAAVDLQSLARVADILVFVTSSQSELREESGCGLKTFAVSLRDAPPSRFYQAYSPRLLMAGTFLTYAGYLSFAINRGVSDTFRGTPVVESLTGYTLVFRLVPVLAAAPLVVLCGLGLRLIWRPCWQGQRDRATSGRPLEPAEEVSNAPQVRFWKPELRKEIEKEAKLGPVELQVCGPQRLIAAVSEETRVLKERGFDVHLDIHQSEM